MMDYEISKKVEMPYLQAIQKVPGDTASEKLSWIGRLSLHETSEDLRRLPPELLPILRVETAIKKKRHEDIMSALQSEDATIIKRALKASWFFDGSYKHVVHVRYFCERIFCFVTLNTRTRIVRTLAHRLSGKDPIFAQQLFTAVLNIFNMETAYPLLVACDEDFIYKTIVEKGLVLPVTIANKIFRKNPDLIVRFLKLLKPRGLISTERSPFAIDIDKYMFLLPKLIKKRLEAFIELCEIHKTDLPDIVLSNTCAEIFLKKAQQHLINNPLLYIRILPLKKIHEDLMERIFPDLLPAKIYSFNIEKALDYLKHYPCHKKYNLIRKSFKNKYHADILETADVTPTLLQLLPAKERIEQAKIKIGKQNLSEIDSKNTLDYKRALICYLSVNEAIPVIKEKLNKAKQQTDRVDLVLQLIYVCKINEDDDALSRTLRYILNRHKNETICFFEEMFDQFLRIYDVSHLNKEQISLVQIIVRLCYIKYKLIKINILSAIIRYKLMHNMPLEELADMFLELDVWWNISWYFKEYPCERQFLVAIANVIKKKSFESNDERRSCFYNFIESMYDFNNRCNKSCIKIEKMTIKDYPCLIDIIVEIINSKEDSGKFRNVKTILQKNESELYRSLFPKDVDIADVTSGAALALLNRDSQNILDNWEKYFEACMKHCYLKTAQHFVKATRWYKDLPIKFADRCIHAIYYKNEIASSMAILALLLRGEVVTELIDPFIPMETTVDTNHPDAKINYNILQNISLSIRLSNPPVPLALIGRLCKGDYLSIALMSLINVSRRTSQLTVTTFARNELMNMRVSTRKFGIRLMYLVASATEIKDFLQYTWETEKHHSIREVLFEEFQNFFFKRPSPATWSLYCQTMSTFNLELNDDLLLCKIKVSSEIPNEYIVRYLELWLKTIDDLQRMGLDIQKANKYIAACLMNLSSSVFILLPEEFTENILQKFLFHIDPDISEAVNSLAISHILSGEKDKYAARIKVFADIFQNAITTYQNVPKKLNSDPVNKVVCLFMNDFVFSYVDKSRFNKSTNPEIIDNMQTIFLSVLSPKQNARSYLLLVYAKKLQESTSTETSFGLRLGQQLHELTIFSSLLIPFMTNILEYFLSRVYNTHSDLEEIRLSVIEGLVEADNTDSCFMAVTMLSSNNAIQTEDARYDRLIAKFREMEEPIITVLYDYLN